MKIKLRKRRKLTNYESIEWTHAYPFAVNPRGILVHRVRDVTTHLCGKEKKHHSVHYLCGNLTCFAVGSEREVIVENPPKDRLLCSVCEFRAKQQRLPGADKLAGRHVHIGVLRAHQLCCRKMDDN